ncbi:MAG: hypothetical protein LUC95_01985 [Lachnospiraceae bacterium]|nr:hypothetical protein [Lachnospiraceae bacterium]
MEIEKTAIRATKLEKKFKNFNLNIQKLEIPQGFEDKILQKKGSENYPAA